MELVSNRFASLMGSNGSGKTTLLNIIAGIIKSDEGEILSEGFSDDSPKVGYVWQNFKDSLLPWFTVEDNIAFPIRASEGSWESGRELARKLLGSFLPDVAPNAKTYQLSGGQQQMVSLLRAVVLQPDVLLLDEPFSSLDQHRSWNTALYVQTIWTQQPIPILFVSHDVDEAILLSDDIWLLSRNKAKIAGHVTNPLPRPRTLDMLTDAQHVRCRNEVIGFLRSENGT
jgi:NitT/TauT family transport system ATP-binding protein